LHSFILGCSIKNSEQKERGIIMALKSNCPTLPKIGEDEEMFTLRAQDITSPRIVLEWIKHNFESAGEEKLREAFECALRMKKHHSRKMPD
jgi:hypothetical protein